MNGRVELFARSLGLHVERPQLHVVRVAGSDRLGLLRKGDAQRGDLIARKPPLIS